jgi:hypothetical protein
MKLIFILLFQLFYSLCMATTECIVVSGLEKDHDNVLLAEKLYLRKYPERCKVVNSWTEVKPISKNGSQVLIIQASHGNPGGFSDSDSGIDSPYLIQSSIKNLSKNYKLGVFLESCYSGDFMNYFLSEDNDVQKNTCLITNSVLNRPALGGTNRSNFESLLNLGTNKSLNTFFLESATQGLISSADWHQSGLIHLTRNSNGINRKLSRLIDSLLKTDNQLICHEDHNRFATSLALRAGCSEFNDKELSSIFTVIVEELPQIPQGAGGSPGAIIGENNLFAEPTIQLDFTKIAFFKTHKLMAAAEKKCANQNFPNSCILDMLLPKQCKSKLTHNQEKIVNFLLGNHVATKGVFEDFDPASFLHHLNKQKLKSGKRSKRKDDISRYEACEQFIVNSAEQ